MKVAAITVVGQHPKGLDLHIRNLKWALSGTDYTIHIFTNDEWKFQEYENVEFHLSSVPDVYRWYSYWTHEVPLLLARSDVDVFLFSEQDLFYLTPLSEYLKHSFETKEIIINDECQHDPIKLQGKALYPCIWEGGTIVDKTIIEDAILKGIRFDKDVGNKWIFEQIQGMTDEVFRGSRLRSHKNKFQLDTFAEFCLFCYFRKVKVIYKHMLVHFAQLETMHRKHPMLYDKFDPLCVEYFGRNSFNIIFMYFLSGCYKWDDIKDYVTRLSTDNFYKLGLLKATYWQWMTPCQCENYEHLISAIKDKGMTWRILHY